MLQNYLSSLTGTLTDYRKVDKHQKNATMLFYYYKYQYEEEHNANDKI